MKKQCTEVFDFYGEIYIYRGLKFHKYPKTKWGYKLTSLAVLAGFTHYQGTWDTHYKRTK